MMYICLFLFDVFMCSFSQVLLKKAAMKTYTHVIYEYLNVKVMLAYGIFLLSTVLTMLAYRGVPLSMGPIIEATSYIYVFFFGITIFGEKISAKKITALAVILLGIVVYAISS